MKKILGLLFLLFAMLIGIAISKQYLKNPQTFGKNPTAEINGHVYNLQVARSAKEKEIGLSQTKKLDKDSAMLFPFEKPDYYSFWMKDMKLPIDIIFISTDKIVTIHQNVQPPKTPGETLPIFKPSSPSDKVLEINAGQSADYNFKEGDSVKFENIQ